MTTAVDITARLIERTLEDNSGYRKIDDSFYLIHQGSAYVMINVLPWGKDRAMVRCTASLVKGIQLDHTLATELLELNGHLRFGAFAWDPAEETVMFTHTILGGTTLDADELIATLSDLALISDEYDDKLKKKYGGQRMADLIEEAAIESLYKRGQSIVSRKAR